MSEYVSVRAHVFLFIVLVIFMFCIYMYMSCTSWDFVQVITRTKSCTSYNLYKNYACTSYSSLMFGNIFMLLTFQITVGLNIGIPFKEMSFRGYYINLM